MFLALVQLILHILQSGRSSSWGNTLISEQLRNDELLRQSTMHIQFQVKMPPQEVIVRICSAPLGVIFGPLRFPFHSFDLSVVGERVLIMTC